MAAAAPTLPPGAVAVVLGPQARLWLLPQRAAFDPDRGLLFVADAHLGKAVSFRRLGVPVPAGTTAQALARLDEAIAATQAQHIVFLGDLLHSRRSLAPETLAEVGAWRARHALHAGDPPADWQVRALDGPLHCGPWALLHEPAVVPGAYALAGHVHPGVVLGGRANDRLRLPCFRFGASSGLLPAFGEFTGLHVPERQAAERVYAVAGQRVFAV